MQVWSWCLKHRKILIIDGVCLLLAFLLMLLASHLGRQAYSQQEAQRWAADKKPYHQVSAFWPASEKVGKERISTVRSTIQRKLTEASLYDESHSGKVWTDAFAAQTTDSVTRISDIGLKGKENVQILGVGGSYFLFHPLKMVSGSLFSEEDVMNDRVVIDRNTAWTLFGGYDIAGQSIKIADKTFLVAGVYEPEDSKSAQKAFDGKSVLMMDYGAFHKLYEEAPIISYEAVLPNPIRSFALNTLQDAAGGEEVQVLLVDNTSRFSAKDLLVRFADMSRLFMRQDAVVLPYWENEMRALEWQLYCLLLLRLLLMIAPIVSAAFAVIYLIRRYGRNLWKRFWTDLFERIRKKFYERPIRIESEFEDE